MIMNVYTDGASKGNPGIGGWGWYCPTLKKAMYGGSYEATNNQMELYAIRHCLTWLLEGDRLEGYDKINIHSDSAYCVNALTTWVYGWAANSWTNSKKQPVANKEMFEEVLRMIYRIRDSGKFIFFIKVKGHSGDPANEKADELANKGVLKIQSEFHLKPRK